MTEAEVDTISEEQKLIYTKYFGEVIMMSLSEDFEVDCCDFAKRFARDLKSVVSRQSLEP